MPVSCAKAIEVQVDLDGRIQPNIAPHGQLLIAADLPVHDRRK
jgi:hypothetical protein